MPAMLRVVEASAWVKTCRRSRQAVCKMPVPESFTVQRTIGVPACRCPGGADVQHHVAVLGELDRVVGRVGQRLAGRPGSPTTSVGVFSSIQAEPDLLELGLRGDGATTLRTVSWRSNGIAST
ncbi:MAG: hypothetical protein R2909_20615 [Gemmatimonadales bacterium]